MKRLVLGSVPELRYEPHPWRTRALVDGQVVVDSVRAMLVWEPRRLVPVFAVPPEDVSGELRPAAREHVDLEALPPMLGPDHFEVHTAPGRPVDVVVGDRTLARAAFRPDAAELEGRLTLDFDAFDGWLQEDDELVGHAHDPYKRIDTARSSRHVVVSLHGQVLADTTRAVALFETHLPVRWYLPPEDVRMDLLEPSAHRSTCAYKGHASYLSLRGAGPEGAALAWTYPDPLHDALPVAGLVCFWSERTDLALDGEPVRRPVTPWSPPEELARVAAEDAELG